MSIEWTALLWPYALAAVVLPFVLFDVWRTRHEPKGQDARRALLARWAKEREEAQDDAWHDAEGEGHDDDGNRPAITGKDQD